MIGASSPLVLCTVRINPLFLSPPSPSPEMAYEERGRS
jgi:hypothetical protein